MAESIFLLVEKISAVLIHEAVYLHGVNDEVDRLKAEMKRMQCFLKDAERKQEQSQQQRFRHWVAKIRDLAYDAEDVIDTFVLKLAAQRGFKRFTSIFTNPFHVHKLRTQIKTILTKLDDIRKSLETYGIKFEEDPASSSSAITTQRELRRSYPHFEENDLVGLVDARKQVMDQLMTEEEKTHFVSIVGMGGIGKTTLAKKVYNSIDVKRWFDCCAWAFISQQCSAREILGKIMVDFGECRKLVDQLTEEDLCERVYNFLKEKRYLVVLDDIWKNEDWDRIKQAFPRRKKGSKILFTTRKKEVALHADLCSFLIDTPLMTDEQSWELLQLKAFSRSPLKSHDCLQEFEKLGREMVKKCGGLPLAIILLGGLLETKRSLDEWEVVHSGIHISMNKFQEEYNSEVEGILALSYKDLPSHLKPCFLYLGHYPEDWEISKKKLIRLWIAEGFISPSAELEGEELLMEDVAEQYLQKLINRCLVQVERRDHTGKGVKTCRIHDLLRDLCVSKAKEEKFLGIIPSSKTQNEDYIFTFPPTRSMPRRIACHIDEGRPRFGSHGKRYVNMNIGDDSEKGYSRLRSILLCQDEVVVRLDNPNRFKLLRVLSLVRKNADLSYDICEWKVPNEIGNLIHLRYLALECVIVILPSSIGNLKSLQTLYIRSSLKVPNVLSKLKNLRHLSVWGGFGQMGTLELKNIITLKLVEAKNLIKDNAVFPMNKIQSLGIAFRTSEEVELILKSSILRSKRLHSLWIVVRPSTSTSDLEPLSGCHHLSRLRIDGKIQENRQSRRNVFEFLPENIAFLDLIVSELEQDPMPSLEKLPRLKTLFLRSSSYLGSKMVCSANGFPLLDYLSLQLTELEEWEVEEGAMPCLKHLRLFQLSKLRMVPEGLRHVKTLQKLELISMESLFMKRIQVIDGREGEDFCKVCHIPSITSMWTNQ